MDSAMVLNKDWASRPSVTRDEIAQQFSQSMPQVEERVLGYDYRQKIRMKELEENPNRTIAEDNELSNIYGGSWGRNEGLLAPAKFQQYTLPGGENYREVLLKLPEQEAPYFKDFESYFKSQFNPTNPLAERIYREGAMKSWDASGGKIPDYKSAQNYLSSHYDDPNILAHLRMSDRTGPNGEKILHVEEVQSDWGQEGRKKGFKQLPNPEKERPLMEAKQDAQFAWEKARQDFLKGHEEYAKSLRDQYERMGERWGLTPEEVAADNAKSVQEWKDMTPRQRLAKAHSEFAMAENPAELPHYSARNAEIAASQARDRARNSLFEYHKSIDSGTPSAPYVTSTQGWTDLALKRALKEAAEGGYDKLVWTPGAEQAKRYSLSNQVDELKYVKNDNGTYDVIPIKGGEPLHRIERENIPDKELEALFGRDVAEKMRNQEGDVSGNARSLSGQNLEVGGGGMKSYYDQMLPKRLQELVKKHDKSAKVEFGRLPVQNYTISAPDIARELGMTVEEVSALPHDQKMALINTVRHSITAPGVTITPQMRESILRGQHAFADGGSVVDRALMLLSKKGE
jgi:hypothetical protein